LQLMVMSSTGKLARLGLLYVCELMIGSSTRKPWLIVLGLLWDWGLEAVLILVQSNTY
jgi:hypothetical protein